MVIEMRNSLVYEACWWTVSVQDNLYRSDTGAYIELTIDKLVSASAYIYEGSDRSNVTAFIEGNSTAVVGVPYRVPISGKLIVVMSTIPGGMSG